MTKLPYWGSRYSNRIQGTDGTIFHPNVDPKETLFMFSADICRSIYATNTGERVQLFSKHLGSSGDHAFQTPLPLPPPINTLNRP